MERLEERERKLAQMKMFALDDQPQKKIKSTPKVETDEHLGLNLEGVTLDKNHSAVVQEIDTKQIIKKRRRTIQTQFQSNLHSRSPLTRQAFSPLAGKQELQEAGRVTPIRLPNKLDSCPDTLLKM